MDKSSESQITRLKVWLFDDFKKKKWKWSTIAVIVLTIGYFKIAPFHLFNTPYSTVLFDKKGELLCAKIAADGQWRYPPPESIPNKFNIAITHFEDEYFYYHFGINPVSIAKAVYQNITSHKIKRGGSTITQQVIRLSRQNKKRTYSEKFIEFLLAIKLEIKYSKNSILNLYASHAPFGGNIVGLEMAAWRYFGVTADQLSWAESATLAVLPNAPAFIYPGKNHDRLLQKRNNLLKKIKDKKLISQDEYLMAIAEPLPDKAFELPQHAPHLLSTLSKTKEGQRIYSTIDIQLQKNANHIANQYYQQNKQSEIYNLAILIADNKSRNVLAYIGNSPTDIAHQKDVDIIRAARSTGSILKPFLYAAMLDDGSILPQTLIPDIPTQIGGFSPKNFYESFDGAVPADKALARSLNVPSVLMLQQYGVERFQNFLQKLNIKTISKSSSHYGLSLILGGAEARLWDLCGAYANMSSSLLHYTTEKSQYRKDEFSSLNALRDYKLNFGDATKHYSVISAASIWHTLEAMKKVNRPEGEEAWEFFDSSLEIAWKTGTSFGNRDGWAIGLSKDYVVGIWVGNASGEGRPSLTGIQKAAPILFDIFRLLPKSTWFDMPYSDLESIETCVESGFRAGENCVEKSITRIKKNNTKTLPCPYHRKIYVDKNEEFRVSSDCESIDNIISKSWFVLPPVLELYYKANHMNYLPLPPYRADCTPSSAYAMDFIYPKEAEQIRPAKGIDGSLQPFVAKVAHSNKQAQLHWYLDNVYLGTTKIYHEQPIFASNGKHLITVIDENGQELKKRIDIMGE